ncbi:MAG: hypothetical protein IJX39_06680 [Clostridia bacterium]|nr:hypothetical protein [Clostridia bacterium]
MKAPYEKPELLFLDYNPVDLLTASANSGNSIFGGNDDTAKDIFDD